MPRSNRRSFIKASGGVATLGILAGCSGGGGGDGGGDGGDGGGDGGDGGGGDGGDGGEMTGTPGGDSEPITIGAIEPLSGPYVPWATHHRNGLQFAVQEINQNGGVLGRELELIVSDTGADPAKADSEFRRLVEQENAVATTGGANSDVGVRLNQTANDLEVSHVMNMGGADEIITKDNKFMFRLGFLPGSAFMQAQAEAFADENFTSVEAIVADYAFGRTVQSAIEEHFDQDINIQVAPVGASDFSSYIREFADDVELLLVSGHPAGSVPIANQTFELGYSPEVIPGATIVPDLLVGGLSDAALESWVHIHPTDPYTDAYADVASRFGEANDSQFTTHTCNGYVTGKMFEAAIKSAGEATGPAIANEIINIEFDTLFANPIQYSQYGELDQAVLIYSRLLKEAPPYDSEGTHTFEERFRSPPIPAPEPST